jgi:outer membrane receptor for ferrienterochelin and colicin
MNKFGFLAIAIIASFSSAAAQSQTVVNQRRTRSGPLEGYYRRLQRHHGGRFITREQLDQKTHESLSEILKAIPGVSAARVRGTTGAVRLRGETCRPVVWLDGTPLLAAEVDLDTMAASSFQGIEIYSGPASTPVEFTTPGGSACGTIVLWSRDPSDM